VVDETTPMPRTHFVLECGVLQRLATKRSGWILTSRRRRRNGAVVDETRHMLRTHFVLECGVLQRLATKRSGWILMSRRRRRHGRALFTRFARQNEDIA